MGNKVHGVAFPGQHLTGGLNYYTVQTLVDITPSATQDITDTSQKALDALVQTISLRAQPVIMGQVTSATVAATAATALGLTAAGSTGNVTVYTMKFAIEHNMAWEVSSNNPNLAESLNGLSFSYEDGDTAPAFTSFVYVDDGAENNVIVTFSADLV